MFSAAISATSLYPHSAPQPSASPQRQQHFFENITAEVHASAIACAVVTSAINSLTDWRTPIEPLAVAQAAPSSMPLRSLLAVHEANIELGPCATPLLMAFLDELDDARISLDLYLDASDDVGASRAGALHASRLQTVWRPLCRECKGIVAEIHDAVPVSLPELYSQNVRVVSALLTGAANGLRPCLDADGKLYIPPLPQKRRWARRTVLQDCIVGCGETTQPAFVRDASAGGLGLERVHGLRRGDRITITLASGRILSGLVAWSAGTSAGVRFETPLSASDPMIAL